MQKPSPIKSVSDALLRLKSDALFEFFQWPYLPCGGCAYIRYQKMFGIWFRGQSDQSWRLIPSIFTRGEPGTGPYIDESASTYHFILRAGYNAEQSFRNTFDWLCLMQHYNCPTRLLDWTENLLVGLYFACQGDPDVEGALYVLNTVKLNIVTRAFPAGRSAICIPDSPEVALRAELALVNSRQDFSDHLSSVSTRDFVAEAVTVSEIRDELAKELSAPTSESKILQALRRPVAVLPARRHPRMTLQQSGFTLHGGKIRVIALSAGEVLPSPIALEDLNDELPQHEQFLYGIPVENKRGILEELELMGIHGAALFPELEYQANFIRTRWSYDDVPSLTPS